MTPPDGENVSGGAGPSGGAVVSSGGGAVVSSGGAVVSSGGASSSGSVVSSGGAVVSSGGKWYGDDWRQKMAGGDDKKLARLGRYDSPEKVAEALAHAQARIDAGQVKEPFPTDGTPEQQVEWRKANGVAEAPDKYDLTLKGGVVLGEADKPVVESFLKHVHPLNWSNDQVKQGLEWYHAYQEQQILRTEEADATFKQDNVAKLGQKYGKDYKQNIALVDTLLKEMPEPVRNKLLNGRSADGRPIGADADIIDWLVDIARFKYPVPSAIGGNSEAAIKSAEAEIAAIEKRMRTDRRGYNKDEKMQARYRELIDGLQQVKARKAG